MLTSGVFSVALRSAPFTKALVGSDDGNRSRAQQTAQRLPELIELGAKLVKLEDEDLDIRFQIRGVCNV